MSEQPEDCEAIVATYIEHWHRDAIATIRDGRIKNGLSQAEVARRMGTHQPEISRIENGGSAGISIRRFYEYALACDVVPFTMEYFPIEMVLEYVKENQGTLPTKKEVKRYLTQ